MTKKTSKVIAKPVLGKDKVSNDEMERFISGAPDGGHLAPASTPPAGLATATSSRKKPISLTINDKLLADLDRKAAALGISRAAAFSLAVSRFIAAEEREANR